MTGVALVLGGAASLWDDLENLERFIGGPWRGRVIAVNDSGYAYPHRIHDWVSLHPAKFRDPKHAWIERRREAGYEMGGITYWGGIWRTGMHDTDLVDRVLPCVTSGSSGFHAVMVAFHYGLKALAAGIPMDDQPHFHNESDEGPWQGALGHRESWTDKPNKGWAAILKPRFRSMSGWTRDTYGPPSRAFLGL